MLFIFFFMGRTDLKEVEGWGTLLLVNGFNIKGWNVWWLYIFVIRLAGVTFRWKIYLIQFRNGAQIWYSKSAHWSTVLWNHLKYRKPPHWTKFSFLISDSIFYLNRFFGVRLSTHSTSNRNLSLNFITHLLYGKLNQSFTYSSSTNQFKTHLFIPTV